MKNSNDKKLNNSHNIIILYNMFGIFIHTYDSRYAHELINPVESKMMKLIIPVPVPVVNTVKRMKKLCHILICYFYLRMVHTYLYIYLHKIYDVLSDK